MINVNEVFLSGNVVAEQNYDIRKQGSQYSHLEWQQINM